MFHILWKIEFFSTEKREREKRHTETSKLKNDEKIKYQPNNKNKATEQRQENKKKNIREKKRQQKKENRKTIETSVKMISSVQRNRLRDMKMNKNQQKQMRFNIKVCD